MSASRLDTIVIGSGFGGAVTACRLAERGERVLVLERGRRWDPATFPRAPGDAWRFDAARPQRRNGWLDLRIFPDMIVAQGAGVGGGSLIYANVSVPATPETFAAGWPREITYQELAPHLEEVGRMLDVAELPPTQDTERLKLLREGAERVNAADRFRRLPLAVRFAPDWHYGLENPFDPVHSKVEKNRFGVEQGTCVHLGYCDIGCPVRARNTLDFNYLVVAERHHAEIRPLHLVRRIEPAGRGYVVHYDFIDRAAKRLVPGRASATRVVVAAGSLGSTELLLRCRDQYRTLLRLSPKLGQGWSSNGDFLTPAWYPGRSVPVTPTRGPTIAGAIDFLDGIRGSRFFIEDGGIPDVVQGYLDRKLTRPRLPIGRARLLAQIQRWSIQYALLRDLMPWFAQGVDAADGTLRLGRRWYAPWQRRLALDWDIKRSEATIEAIIRTHRELAAATGGRAEVPLLWTLFRNLITPHPLGGCNMGTTAADGVVDHRGEVFGHPGLFVADGSIVPESLGLNPSRTIAALAERIVGLMR